MDDSEILALVVAVAAVVVLVLLAIIAAKAAKRRKLRERFGPEYDRAVARAGSRKQAELDLRERASAREEIQVRPLTREARDRYREEWHRLQLRFVDGPDAALDDADDLLDRVMQARGYPAGSDPDRRADLVGVDHPGIVEHYREARRIRHRNRTGVASTDDVREAVVRYRALFEELLDDEGSDARRDRRGEVNR
jgi:hypothetical protein